MATGNRPTEFGVEMLIKIPKNGFVLCQKLQILLRSFKKLNVLLQSPEHEKFYH
jgi:hypothetical protein